MILMVKQVTNEFALWVDAANGAEGRGRRKQTPYGVVLLKRQGSQLCHCGNTHVIAVSSRK